MYCNAACKKKHRSKHKKQCERRVAELHDEKLFKQPPILEEDCPICFLRMPLLGTGKMYMACCGKVICCGCMYAPVYDNQGNEVVKKLCPFCRSPPPNSDEEFINIHEKRMELNDAEAIYSLASFYSNGKYGLRPNQAKALELFHRAGELGNAAAYYSIGNAYHIGNGVEIDEKMAMHYWELAAMRGHVKARNNLGVSEGRAGNSDRALKHLMIAAKGGDSVALKSIKRLYPEGLATKDEYNGAIRSYQAYFDEIKSDQRDEAAAFSDRFKYY